MEARLSLWSDVVDDCSRYARFSKYSFVGGMGNVMDGITWMIAPMNLVRVEVI